MQAVVAHLGIEIEAVLLDPSRGEHKAPDYLSVNPNGRVPSLVDGDLQLWESHAIMQYLCSLHGDTLLFPRDVRRRADIVRWQCWELAHFGHHLAAALFERVFKPFAGLGAPDEAIVRRSLRAWSPSARVLDDQLSDRPFVCGDITLADFSLAAQFSIASCGRVDLEPYPHILSWLHRLDEIPAWRETRMPDAFRRALEARLSGARS